MGKISVLTKEQKIILDGIKLDRYIQERFYFTGGSALAEYYLRHRYSEDLDFFTEKLFDHQLTLSFIGDLSKKIGFEFTSEAVAAVQMFFLEFKNGRKVKIDFNYYGYPRLKPSVLKAGLYVDNAFDIAVNKLLTINQRDDIKDFVDFYYLEPKFGVWDLIEGVRRKFGMKLDPWIYGSDFLKVEDFTFLPRMIKPLDLKTLKRFFRQKAKEVGRKAVE